MKTRLITGTLVSLLAAAPLFAKGIFITPGSRANSMGGAFVAIADDPTAMYWNPAGLALQGKFGTEVSAFYLNSPATSNQSLGNATPPDPAANDFPLPGIYGGVEPLRYNSKKLSTEALLPFVGGFTRLNDIVLGLSFYASGGGGGKWEDSVHDITGADTINASVDSRYSFLITNFSAAANFTPQLSAGVGIDLIGMDDKTLVKKQYIQGTGSLVPVPYNMQLEKKSDGTATQGVIGFLYRPADRLRLGLVYRTGATVKLTGTATFNDPAGVTNGGTPVSFASAYTQNYTYPRSFGFGIAADPSDDLTVSFGLDSNSYSSMKQDITYDAQLAGMFVNSKESLNWKDTTQVRLGAEYRATPEISIRAGYQTDPAPYAVSEPRLLDINQYALSVYTIGAEYDFGGISIDGTYGYGISDTVKSGGTEMTYPLNIFRVGLRYGF